MGPYLATPITNKTTHLEHNKQLRFVSVEMQGWRKTMQDSKIHKINIPGGISIFGVFDGHGGFQVSKFVQRNFLNELLKNQYFKKQDYEKALLETFKRIDDLIDSAFGIQQLKKIRKENGGQTAQDEQIAGSTGCTANVLIITPTKYYVANAGDSRSVLSRNGVAIALSQDHKPENQIEKNRITKAGGNIVNGRVNGGLNLSRSFGDFYYKRERGFNYDEQLIISKPDIKVQERSKNDQFIIMGCDGIWERYVNDNQGMVNKIFSQRKIEKDPVKVMKEMLDFLLAKETSQEVGCDNMTAILIEFNKIK